MKNKNISFSFSFVTKETNSNELPKLNPKKLVRKVIFQSKFQNLDIVLNLVNNSFNNSLFSSHFPSRSKNAIITPIFKKKDRDNVKNHRPGSILPNHRKYMKGVCTFKLMNTSIKFFQNGNAAKV